MQDVDENFVAVRRRILELKDGIVALSPEVARWDVEAAASMTRARAALFEAWTILVGPPEEDEDH